MGEKVPLAASVILCGHRLYIWQDRTAHVRCEDDLLIDSSGNSQTGDSKYVEGGVGLIDMEKNLPMRWAFSPPTASWKDRTGPRLPGVLLHRQVV